MSPRGRMPSRIPGEAPSGARLADGLRALASLGPYLWPRESLELRARVVLAVGFLFAGKIINILVPLFYKHAVDALSGQPDTKVAIAAVPIALILGYGIARILAL